MSAQLIFDAAPLGAIVRYSDGTPRPPDRHRRKLQAWERHNNTGRLVKKKAATVVGQTTIPASFTLHEGDFGSNAVIVLRVFRTFSVGSALEFSIVERPAAGSILERDHPADAGELVHVAQNRQAADEWLSRHGYPEAELREVTADEAAANRGEGRAA
ncbi:MAG: hypothetical protein KAH44_07795 [Oricola sp.]|uniref:hypothetical protein n=1 Tax=Hoeflea sp. TaxID=1940281 RepID=UPI00320BC692|nr:hypothetical protein [Oricola sp.]